jgi:hypothetical protein
MPDGRERLWMDVVVRKERLELSRVAPLEPKSSASTNSATLATPRLIDPMGEVVGRVGFEPTTY